MTAPARIVLRIDRMRLPAGHFADEQAVRTWLAGCGAALFDELESSGSVVSSPDAERSLRRAFVLPQHEGGGHE